jgi:peptide/nickel transport system permease protein
VGLAGAAAVSPERAPAAGHGGAGGARGRRPRSTLARLAGSWSGRIGLAIAALLVAMASAGPTLYPVDPYRMAVAKRLKPPSAEHPLGTDEFGRDLLARIIHGSRISLRVGLISVGIGGLAGTALGLAAGLGGRRVDLGISGVVDVMLAFPGFLLALAIVATLGPSLENAMIAIGIRRVPVFVRVVRAGILQLASAEFVLAARALGASPLRVAVLHVLRNVAPTLVVLATLQFPEALLVSAGLSFLGLGAQPPLPEWGALLTSARVYIARAPWLVNVPGAAILVTVLGLNLLGNALRDVLDPRLK